jgi:DUF4097 and DUF4098 domain-containing protein YvlB
MKKLLRNATIAGAALVFSGFALSGFSFTNIQHDLHEISRQPLAQKQATFDADSVKKIRVDIDNVKVTVKTETGIDRVTVDYYETKTDKFSVNNSNGTVSLWRAEPARDNFICFYRCMDSGTAITVTVPTDSIYAYDLTAANAPVTIENDTSLQADTVRIASSNSTVRLENIVADKTIRLQSNNGNIRMNTVSTGGNLTLESNNGTNHLVEVKAAKIDSRADNGNMMLERVTANEVTAVASNGTIRLDRLNTNKAMFTSDNGNVRGSLDGSKEDYRIRLTSDNGSIRVNNTEHNGTYLSDNAAAKQLTVQSSNGTVDITFEQ